MDILAHRGSTGGAKILENTMSAIHTGILAGFGLELDLRLKEGRIILAHDVDSEIRDDFEWVVSCFREKMFQQPVAFHLKENNEEMMFLLKGILRGYSNFFFFGFDTLKDLGEYANWFGNSKVAYEYESSGKGNIDDAIRCRAEKVWMVDFTQSFTIDTFEKLKHKELYLISPEVINQKFIMQEHYLHYLAGICSDVPQLYKNI